MHRYGAEGRLDHCTCEESRVNKWASGSQQSAGGRPGHNSHVKPFVASPLSGVNCLPRPVLCRERRAASRFQLERDRYLRRATRDLKASYSYPDAEAKQVLHILHNNTK